MSKVLNVKFSKILSAEKLELLGDISKYEEQVKSRLAKEVQDNQEFLANKLHEYEERTNDQIRKTSEELYTYTYNQLTKLFQKISNNLTPVVARVLNNFALDEITNEQIGKMIINELSNLNLESNKVRISCNEEDLPQLKRSLRNYTQYNIEYKVSRRIATGECEVDTGLCILKTNCNKIAQKLKGLAISN